MSNAPILVLEGDPATKRQLSQVISSINQSMFVADDPRDLMQTVQSRACPLAIIDVLFPGLEPYTFVQQLRQIRTDMRILAVGVNINPAAITELVKRGASDFMPKPFETNTLRSRLEENLRMAAEAQIAAAFSESGMGVSPDSGSGPGYSSSGMGYGDSSIPQSFGGGPGGYSGAPPQGFVPAAPQKQSFGGNPALPSGFRAPTSPGVQTINPNHTAMGNPTTSQPGSVMNPPPTTQQSFSAPSPPPPQDAGMPAFPQDLPGGFDLTGVAPPPRQKRPEDADLGDDARKDLAEFLDHVLQQYLEIEQENMRLHRRVMALEDPGFAAKQKRTPSAWIAHSDPEFSKGMIQLTERLQVDFRPPLATGGEILDKLSSLTPDLIILGDMLHDIPGEFVVDTVRSEYSHVACIIVNGWGSPQMSASLKGPGSADAIDTDLKNAEDLIALIERAKQRIFDADVGVEFAAEFKERHDEFLKRYAAIKAKVDAG